MKPTTKILMALSALLSINALALFEGVARSVDNTTSAVTRPMTGRPAPVTQQSSYVPQQGVNTSAPRPYSTAQIPPRRLGINRRPMTSQAMGQNANPGYGRKPAFFNQPTNTSGIQQRYVGSSNFEKSHMPQDTHPANVEHTSDDEIML